MTASDVSGVVSEVQAGATTVLEVLGAADPEVELPVETAEAVVALVGGLVTKALNAFSAASGTPITAESVLALLPNPTPLSPPDPA